MNDVRKRKLSCSEGQTTKRYYFTLEPEGDAEGTSDSDSIHTIQSTETAIVGDTSDTCTKSSASEPELSPASLSEPSYLDGSTGSSSSFDGPAFFDVVINVKDDDHSLADVSLNSDSNSNSIHHDAEIPKADYWQCARCGCKKNNPVFRYCAKCFQIRKKEALPRPTTTRKKRQKSHHRFARQQSASKLAEPGPSSGAAESLSQETLASTSSLSSQDSGVSVLSNSGSVDLCNGCDTEKINAAFYHTSFGHMWGCYKCSKKAWKLRRRCPVCNGQSRVIRLFK